ncbi:mucin-12-like [Carassius auratus]|uniref:Mucin-12-like n=1 Tax=Carassius auratus TaxID=7957 RepID=A0A6P6KT45_CARAU|nr:mucin-12-like [Carassius auratus]
MGQGWKRLSLLVVFLFWRNADGFKSGAYSESHHGWGQPSDGLTPHAVQSSMSEVHVTGTLPVEEVGSSLFPTKPLKSKSKWNLAQFVKGGSSSYPSMPDAQATPSSSVSVSLPLSRNQQSSSSFASSGSTVPGVTGGLRLVTQYAASGSRPVSTLRERSSYPAQLGVSSQSTSDSLHVSSSQETQSAFSQSTSILSSQKQYSAASQVSSGAQLGASTGLLPQRMSSSSSGSVQSPGSTSQFALGSYPFAASVSLSSPQAGPSTVLGPQKQLTSTYTGSSGTQAGSSTPFTLHGSPAYGSSQPQGTTSLSAPGSPSSYPGLSQSSPQGVASQSSSQKRLTSVYQISSGPQLGASTGLLPQRMSSSSSGSVQSPGSTSQFALGSYPFAASVSLSSPQAGPSTVLGPQKQLTSTYTGSSGTQAGSSTPFTLHGSPAYGGSSQLQDMSHFAASSPYGGLYCKCALSPPGVDHPSTFQSSQKRFTSSYGTQSGSSPFTLQGSVTFDGSQPQGVASQSVHGSLKKLPSTFVGSSGTQVGSSTAILQGGTTYGG